LNLGGGEEVRELQNSPNVKIIESRRMRLMGMYHAWEGWKMHTKL
jgi:hypothetical protein